MHTIEPFSRWRQYYRSEEDVFSPYFQKQYPIFEYTNSIYNYLIHPYWDELESPTLYVKVLFVDYEQKVMIIELFGEWNDAVNNDINFLRGNLIEVFEKQDIVKIIMIGENVLNFHADEDEYYKDWYQNIENKGWIVAFDFRPHVIDEFSTLSGINQYLYFLIPDENMQWKNLYPYDFIDYIEKKINNYDQHS